MSTSTIINSNQYTNITTRINELLSTNQQALISIFSDKEETTYVIDNMGNEVNKLQIISISVTDSYIDPVTNEPVSSSLKIVFNTEGEFIYIDNTDHYWYEINGVDFEVRTFQNLESIIPNVPEVTNVSPETETPVPEVTNVSPETETPVQ